MTEFDDAPLLSSLLDVTDTDEAATVLLLGTAAAPILAERIV